MSSEQPDIHQLLQPFMFKRPDMGSENIRQVTGILADSPYEGFGYCNLSDLVHDLIACFTIDASLTGLCVLSSTNKNRLWFEDAIRALILTQSGMGIDSSKCCDELLTQVGRISSVLRSLLKQPELLEILNNRSLAANPIMGMHHRLAQLNGCHLLAAPLHAGLANYYKELIEAVRKIQHNEDHRNYLRTLEAAVRGCVKTARYLPDWITKKSSLSEWGGYVSLRAVVENCCITNMCNGNYARVTAVSYSGYFLRLLYPKEARQRACSVKTLRSRNGLNLSPSDRPDRLLRNEYWEDIQGAVDDNSPDLDDDYDDNDEDDETDAGDTGSDTDQVDEDNDAPITTKGIAHARGMLELKRYLDPANPSVIGLDTLAELLVFTTIYQLGENSVEQIHNQAMLFVMIYWLITLGRFADEIITTAIGDEIKTWNPKGSLVYSLHNERLMYPRRDLSDWPRWMQDWFDLELGQIGSVREHMIADRSKEYNLPSVIHHVPLGIGQQEIGKSAVLCCTVAGTAISNLSPGPLPLLFQKFKKGHLSAFSTFDIKKFFQEFSVCRMDTPLGRPSLRGTEFGLSHLYYSQSFGIAPEHALLISGYQLQTQNIKCGYASVSLSELLPVCQQADSCWFDLLNKELEVRHGLSLKQLIARL